VASQVSVGRLDPRYPVQFVDGYHRALQVGAAILLAGAVVAVVTVGRSERREPVLEAAPRFEDAA
jgi:hypothetical protein